MTPSPCLRRHAVAIAAVLAMAVLATGCSSVESVFTGDKVDYRSQSAKTDPLEIPPDLTQLARDGRYRPQGGVVSASATAAAPGAGTGAGLPSAAPAAAAAAPAALVAPAAVGEVRVMRDGPQRWLVVPMSPEVLWPQLRAFWLERGFALEIDSPDAGVMETGWAENRGKLPDDLMRGTIGKVFEGAWSTGERDRFRTRVERGPNGTEVFIVHRGIEEVIISPQFDERTVWRNRPNDPSLEAEFLARLMIKLGTREETARAAVATAAEVPSTRARPAATGATSMEVDDGFDRAWRRVGVALDRSGFTIEDRDRAAGIYFVRYVDPAVASYEEPGFFGKLFGREAKSTAPMRLRVLVKGDDRRSVVSVQNAQGAPETGAAAQQIVGALVTELK